MPLYPVIQACRHEVLHDVWGTDAARARRIDWLMGVPCLHCSRASAARLAAAAAARSGLPELRGTVRQVSWAEQIRADAIKVNEKAQLPSETMLDLKARAMGVSLIEIEEIVQPALAISHAAYLQLRRETSAKWWIEQRLFMPYYVSRMSADAMRRVFMEFEVKRDARRLDREQLW